MTTTTALALAALAVALLAVLFAAIACQGANDAHRATLEPTPEEMARMRAILEEYAVRDTHYGRMWEGFARETLGEVPTVAESLEAQRATLEPAATGATFGPWATHAPGCACNVCR